MVTNEEIRKIAKLAKLYVYESELEELTKSMASIIEFADTINNASYNFNNTNTEKPVNATREDELVPSYANDEILSNCKTAREGFFYIAKSVRR